MTIALLGGWPAPTAQAATTATPVYTETMNGANVTICSNSNVESDGTKDGNLTSCGGQAHVGGVSGAWWQCVEFAQRFYTDEGWRSGTFANVPNGAYQIYDNAGQSGFSKQANGAITSIVPGDMIVHGVNDNYSVGTGHVAIINSISSDGKTVHAVQQNASATTTTYALSWDASGNGTLTGGSGSDIRGVVHSPNNTNTGVGAGPAAYPDGSFLSSSNGHVYEMVGNAALLLNQWSDVGGQRSTTAVPQSVVAGLPTVPGNGTFVTDYATGHVYEIVGGSPMLVTSWSNIGGQQPIDAVVADSMLTGMAAQPVDGSFVADYSTSHVYVVAGGALMLITSWSAVGGQHGVAMLDDWAIQQQFRQYPANGAFVVDYATSHVFEIVGGAPLLVTNWNNIGGQQPATVIDDWALQNQFKAYPDDGSFVADYATSHVYVVAGGSLMLITSWSAVGGQHPVAVIDDWAASNQFRAYPADGTYVQGYSSGEEFQASGGTVTRVTTSPLPAATTVDDWAILNQLGGTE